MITREALRGAFLSPQMTDYLHKKLAPLPPAEVELRIEEVLKFLNLAVYSPGAIPVSKEIDDVWHYWVLETAEYEALCRKLPGGRFLHHSSNEYAEFHDPKAKEKEIDPTGQIAYLGAYVKNFGPFEPDRVCHWPFATRLMNLFDWSLSELNARLRACSEAGLD
jgi:hypothetical protein